MQQQLTIQQFLQRHSASRDSVAKRAVKFVDMLQWWWAAAPKDLIWIATRGGALAHKSSIRFALWCAERCMYPFDDADQCRPILRMVDGAKDGFIPIELCESAMKRLDDNGSYVARATRAAVKSLRDPNGGAENASDWGMEHWRFYHVTDPQWAGPRLSRQARWLRSEVEPFFIA